MAITTQTVKVDLNTGKVLPVVYAHQNDTNRAIQFEVYNENAPFSLSGYTVKFGYVSPKINGAYTVIAGDDMASGSINGNIVTFNIPESYLAIAGDGLLTMIISGTGSSIRPVNIRFAVQTSADGSGVMAGASDFPDAWMDEKVYSWLDDHIDGVFTEEQFVDAVDNWLDDHPEATTTVEDGSITVSKLHEDVKKADYLSDVLRPYPAFTIPRTVHTGTSDYYGVQGCCATSDSIIIAEIAADGTNLNCKLTKISQTGYTVVSTEERTLDSANHMNCLTYYPSENEVWAVGTGQTAYVIDADTLAYKRNETTPIATNAMGHDPISDMWMFAQFTSNSCTVHLYKRTGVGEWSKVKQFSIDRMSTTQGATFHDRMIYFVFGEFGASSTYQSLGNENFFGMQNIIAVDLEGRIHKSWWLDSGYIELEDCDILDNGKIIISSNANLGNETAYTIYTAPLHGVGNSENLTLGDRDTYFNSFWLYPYYKIQTNETKTDLNHSFYLRPFTYCASNAAANRMSNLPTNAAFKLTVESALTPYGGRDMADGYQYVKRTFETLNGTQYIQNCQSNASGVWTIGQWIKQPKPYKSGETIPNTDYFSHGFVTGSGREVNLVIQLGQSIENISSAVCEYCRCAVRSVDGTYLGGSTNIDLTSYVTLVTLYSGSNAIAVRLWNDNGWDITNNTPLCGIVRASFVLS